MLNFFKSDIFHRFSPLYQQKQVQDPQAADLSPQSTKENKLSIRDRRPPQQTIHFECEI